jgi:GST-like protein
VLDKQLSAHDYVSADQYTIADMAIFPWCRLHRRQNQDINDFPNVKRWFAMISERPAVAGDMAKLEDIVDGFDKDSWDAAFGGEQYKRR